MVGLKASEMERGIARRWHAAVDFQPLEKPGKRDSRVISVAGAEIGMKINNA